MLVGIVSLSNNSLSQNEIHQALIVTYPEFVNESLVAISLLILYPS